MKEFEPKRQLMRNGKYDDVETALKRGIREVWSWYMTLRGVQENAHFPSIL